MGVCRCTVGVAEGHVMWISSILARCRVASFFVVSGVVSFAPLCAQTSVVVTGSREVMASERLAADVVVITRERINASAADTLEELLRREAGVQVSRNGGPGASAGVWIRGASSAQTLVLIDGVRIGSATTGQAEFEGLSLAAIERIEVLRGPGSSLYGADAVGGVVQIFTRRGVSGVGLAIGVAGDASREISVSGNARLGGVDASASLSRESSRGVSALRPADAFGNYNPDRDGYARSGGTARLALTPASGHRVGLTLFASRLNAQYDASEFLPPSYAQNAAPDFRNHLVMQSAALEHRGDWSAQWSSLMRVATQTSDLKSGGTASDHFRTERRQLEAQVTWKPMAQQQLTLALDALHENALSTLFTADVARRNRAVVLAYAGRIGAVDVQADARSDHNSSYGSVGTGRLGGSLALAPGLRLRGLLGTTFRAPSFNDLYYPGFGVATLQPERGRSGEVGLIGQKGDSEASVTLWRNRVRELIGYESDRSFCPPGFDYDFGCARNIGRARLQGATLTARSGWGAWRGRVHVDFLDARDQSSHARLTRRAAHQEIVALDWQGGTWSSGAELMRVGARPEGGRLLAGYATLDLKAQWRVDTHWSLQAKLLNATNRDYEPALDYRAVGRQAWIGLHWAGGGL